MQLAEQARKRGLASLVRTSDHEDALRVFEKEVVAHDRRLGGDELVGQREVERVLRTDCLRSHGNLRIAKGQSR